MTSYYWNLEPIGNLCFGIYDGPHATPKPSFEGPIFLGIGNITEDGKLDLSDKRHIAEEDFPKWTKRVLPSPGDIVFTYEATLNRYAIIPQGFRGCLGRRLALIRPNPNKIDTRFLFYSFFGAEWRRTIASNIIPGSTVDRIPLVSFPKFPVHVPPLPVQHKIADILSAYDDLIENNTRRIAILEEMARMLYQEWFVKFHFPGYEQVKLVDSTLGMIPEGWDVVKFVDVADVLSGGTPKTSNPEYWNGNIPFFSPRDAPGSLYVIETEKYITESGLKTCSSRLYPKDTIFITARGTVGKVVLNAVDMAMNQSCYALVGKEDISQFFVFLHIENYIRYLKQTANGAVFDTIIVDTFKNLQVVKPSLSVIEQFSITVSPLFEQVLNLLKKNANLRRTRDLLLPKLISGEIDVSSWVEDDGEEMEQELVPAGHVQRGERRIEPDVEQVKPIDVKNLVRHSLWEE
ncbi:MAG: restriction endonuclease subunit S [Ktedonobacteraceae bacterium]|nr:restriction endonuclease subunit S [Ktedonobacteraceae bacterium]